MSERVRGGSESVLIGASQAVAGWGNILARHWAVSWAAVLGETGDCPSALTTSPPFSTMKRIGEEKEERRILSRKESASLGHTLLIMAQPPYRWTTTMMSSCVCKLIQHPTSLSLSPSLMFLYLCEDLNLSGQSPFLSQICTVNCCVETEIDSHVPRSRTQWLTMKKRLEDIYFHGDLPTSKDGWWLDMGVTGDTTKLRKV